MLTTLPATVLAQAVVQPLPGTTDADALADTMRQLAANPNDLGALLHAGELSVEIGDLSAAAALFTRAEKIDPRNPRVKAGEASILVRSERPGEALRYFAMAESFGVEPRRIAADRGLAYDLIGQQDRAQRDYRLALREAAPDDETIRRYALSLGISGRQTEALAALEPLLRKTDRGAWRARAFVMAMNGDVPGATKIATTMMPPGMAQGLQPFFERLPTLPAIDRAFAVHFGEVHATPERLADARLVPALAALGPDPYAPVQVAAVQLAVPEKPGKKDKKHDRDRKAKAVQMASVATPKPVEVAPTPPAYSAAPTFAARSPVVQATPSQPAAVPTPGSGTMVAAQTVRPGFNGSVSQPLATRGTIPAGVATTSVPPANGTRYVVEPHSRSNSVLAMHAVPSTPVTTSTPTPLSPSATLGAAREASTVVRQPATGSVANGAAVASLPAAAKVAAAPAATPGFSSVGSVATQVRTVPAAAAPAPAALASAKPAAPVATIPSYPTGTASTPSAIVAAAPTPTPLGASTASITPPIPRAAVGRPSEDNILARIIAGLSIPASELDVAPPTPAPAVAAAPIATPPSATILAEAKAKEDRDAAARKLADQLAAKKVLADKKAADKKAVADKKALAEKKAAAAEKAIADKKAAAEAAEEKRIARSNPPRIWVQVAGGAYEGDLPKAYAAVRAKAPTAFAGHSGWSTPLRATNRVLAGPFKSGDEARSFVNQLAKSGVSAFTFSSDAGQVVTKLPPK